MEKGKFNMKTWNQKTMSDITVTDQMSMDEIERFAKEFRLPLFVYSGGNVNLTICQGLVFVGRKELNEKRVG